jgi:hypothetical protein
LAIVFAAFIAFGLIVKPNAQATRNLIPLFLLIFLWIGLLWILPKWQARRQFLKQPGARGGRTVLIDAEGVHWRWNGGSSDVAWKNYIRGLEGKDQFLLYTSPACFNIIPKRVLTQEGVLELQGLLKKNISDSG